MAGPILVECSVVFPLMLTFIFDQSKGVYEPFPMHAEEIASSLAKRLKARSNS